MTIKHTITLSFICFLLQACSHQTAKTSCSSTDTQKLLNKLLAEQTEKLTVEKRYDQYDGSFVFGATKVRATLAQIQLAIENANTLKQDENSSKIYCSGSLKVTIPPGLLTDADTVRNSQQQITIAQYAKQVKIENNSNVFTQNINYSLTPTVDGKDPRIEFESASWIHLLDELTTAALLKPTLETQEAFSLQNDESPKQQPQTINTEAATSNSQTDKLKTQQLQQGLDKLNQELLEAEQIEKELAREKTAYQITTPSALPETTNSVSPSFKCENITKPTELTICSNNGLATLDVENMKIYKNAKIIDPTTTKDIWLDSIKSKYACGTDIDCITNVYKQSIQDYGCIADQSINCGANKVIKH